jgi:hypothetical protein
MIRGSSEVREEKRFAAMALHGLFVANGESGIHFADDGVNGRGDGERIGGRARQDGAVFERKIRGDDRTVEIPRAYKPHSG